MVALAAAEPGASHRSRLGSLQRQCETSIPLCPLSDADTAYEEQANQNSTALNAALTDVLAYNGLIPDVTAGSSLDTSLQPLCYEY